MLVIPSYFPTHVQELSLSIYDGGVLARATRGQCNKHKGEQLSSPQCIEYICFKTIYHARQSHYSHAHNTVIFPTHVWE